VSADKAKCVANVCSCPNGIAPSGEKCPIDGAKRCASCDPGYKLDSYTTQEQELNPSFDRRLELIKGEQQPEDTPQEQQQQTTTQQNIIPQLHQICAGTRIKFVGSGVGVQSRDM